MIDGKRVLAIVPARGGSKRLPRKNALDFCGKPLIGWSIDAAKQSQYVDEVFVSTDDQEIADIAWEYEIDVPELRPAHLASDTATTVDVLLDVLDKYGSEFDVLVLLQPTSPLRDADHIDEALELYTNKQAESVVSVTACEHSPLWSNTLPEDGSMGEFISSEALKRSQELATYYRLNGALYIFDIKILQKRKQIQYTSKSFSYFMDNHVSFDIDNAVDFELAEFFMQKRNANTVS